MTLLTRKDEQVTDFFKLLDETLENLEAHLKNSKPTLNNECYYTDQEVSHKLKISRRTLQEYRNQGIISYIQLGGKILYKDSDLQKMLEKNYYKTYN